MTSPLAAANPLFQASYTPLSGPVIRVRSGWLEIHSSVPSLDPPSTIKCSSEPTACDRTFVTAVFSISRRFSVAVTIDTCTICVLHETEGDGGTGKATIRRGRHRGDRGRVRRGARVRPLRLGDVLQVGRGDRP